MYIYIYIFDLRTVVTGMMYVREGGFKGGYVCYVIERDVSL